MMPLPNENRFIRILPGRIRAEIGGLRGNAAAAERLMRQFAGIKGIRKVEPCTISGRLLLLFDEKIASVEDIRRLIREAGDDAPCPAAAEHAACPGPGAQAMRETAAAAQVQQPGAASAAGAGFRPATGGTAAAGGAYTPGREPPLGGGGLPMSRHGPPPDRVPLPLALSMGGLAVLGLKRLFLGSSSLSRSPLPFYLSGLIAVTAGYPFLRRGFRRLAETRKWNADLLLGAGSLALALVRENLVVLAGLGLLQYVQWKRSRVPGLDGQSPPLPAPIRRYGEKAGRWGAAAAAAAWLITRDPLRGIAVLLAANPRPAAMAAGYAWQQAELVSRERGYALPSGGSLEQLGRTKTILVEDASLLFGEPVHSAECAAYGEDADKALCVAASLLRPGGHPWKDEIWDKAKQTCRTIRTAFHVSEDENGVRGKINNALALAGNLALLREYGVAGNACLTEAVSLENGGVHRVLYIAAEINNTVQCIGFIARKEQPAATGGFAELPQEFAAQGRRIAVLQNGSGLDETLLRERGVDTDWLTLEPGEIVEKIAVLSQQGEEVLLAARGDGCTPLCEYLQEAGVPSITPERLPDIAAAAAFGERIGRTVKRQARLAKGWNIAGSVLAFTGALAAPAANLAADALSLLFMSGSRRVSQKAASHAPAAVPAAARLEVAASAEEDLPWHALSGDDVLRSFAVNPLMGFTADQTAEQRAGYGPNQLEGRKPVPWLASFFGQFKEFTTLILLGTVTVALLTGGLFDGIAMGAILLGNAAVGTMQERKAEKVLEALNHYQPPVCKVIRDGVMAELSGAELVPGDIVHLEAGDRVPADIRLLEAWNLRANEAALTGESLPADKKQAVLEPGRPLADRHNMLFMGTDICGGKCVGVVVQTGMRTEMGRLVALLKTAEIEPTPLQRKVTEISKKFVKAALAAAAVLFAVGLVRGIPLPQIISTSVTLAASAIPEGLPVTITIALSAGIFRMAKKKTLIRKLSALETLGRTTVICTDKTGTLTKNEMTVRTVATVARAWSVSGTGYDPSGSLREVGPEAAAATADTAEPLPERQTSDDPDLRRLLEIGLLCNNSKLEQVGGAWTVKGDPTEGALLALSAKNGLWQEQMGSWRRGLEIPFDSDSGKMSVVCHDEGDERKCFVFSKGALEVILRHCSHYLADGETLPLTDEHRELILAQNEQFSREALRVLAFSYRPVERNADAERIDENRMIYVGMAGMLDPPKPEVESSIREAFSLGVKPVMITGDHPITAIAIGKQLGIYDGTQNVLSGDQINRLSDEELFAAVEDTSIFARVTPEHKLRIVRALQQRGQIVAMTGDGVNDTPAIKQADVGIAMGRTGTEVTKETADMVLQEDDFGSIVEAVKEGRTIMGNIRKALGCLLTGNLAEIIVTSVAVAAGLPIPLVPIQILLMNLLTDALPAMILAVNPGNKTKRTDMTDIADKHLYRKVAVKGALLGLGSLGLFAAALAAGAPVAAAQSAAFATLVAGQLIQTFSWRQEGSHETVRDWSRDRFLIGALGLSWMALLAALYVPPLSGFFHTVPLAWKYWPPIIAVAGSVSLLSKPLLALFPGAQGQTPRAGLSPAAA